MDTTTASAPEWDEDDFFETLLKNPDDAYLLEQYRRVLDLCIYPYFQRIEVKIGTELVDFMERIYAQATVSGCVDRDAIHYTLLLSLVMFPEFKTYALEHCRDEMRYFVTMLRHQYDLFIKGQRRDDTPPDTESEVAYPEYVAFTWEMRMLYCCRWNHFGKAYAPHPLPSKPHLPPNGPASQRRE
jgi:hypothetical protein